MKQSTSTNHQRNIEKLGALIRQDRLAKGLSIRKLGAAAGVHHSSVLRLEQGDLTRPTPEFIQRLARALELPLSDLYHLAGLTLPEELPDLGVYLRTKHGLPTQAVEELTTYFEFVKRRYGPIGPFPGEDEDDSSLSGRAKE